MAGSQTKIQNISAPQKPPLTSSAPPCPQKSLSGFSCRGRVSPVLEPHGRGVTQSTLFCVWLFSLSILPARVIFVVWRFSLRCFPCDSAAAGCTFSLHVGFRFWLLRIRAAGLTLDFQSSHRSPSRWHPLHLLVTKPAGFVSAVFSSC